jgi:hypothetical protein
MPIIGTMGTLEEGTSASSQRADRRPGILVTMFEVPEDLEDEFNAWYDHEHIPEKLGVVPGYLRARRYKSSDTRPRYLCIYEIEDLEILETQPPGRGRSERTIQMKSGASAYSRSVYEQISDVVGLPLPGSDIGTEGRA